ncbi:BREX-1 system phosphatase PglZ type A [Faecalimonas sp.]
MAEVNFEEVAKELNLMFARKPRAGQKRNIIFWYDGEGKFQDKLDGLPLEDAKVVIYTGNNSFNIKYLLEKQDTDNNYLIYVPDFRPVPEDNLLLDVYKYSHEFEADIATIYMRELGIKSASLFEVVRSYESFLGAKDRIKRFKNLGIAEWTEQTFHIGVLCSVVKTNFDFDGALIKLICDYFSDGTLYEAVEKFCNIDVLNDYIQQKFGLVDALNDVEKMATNMLLLHMSLYMQGTMPENWARNLPENMNGLIKINDYIFVERLMKDNRGECYQSISKQIAEKLAVEKYASGWDLESFSDVDTFADFDIVTIKSLIKQIVNKGGEYGRYIKIIRERRKSYWNDKYAHDYQAIHYACRFLEKMCEVGDAFHEASVSDMFTNYTKSYYKFDQYYREFIFHYDQSSVDEMLSIYEMIDNHYTNWYLEELGNKWSNINDGTSWGEACPEHQWEFYDKHLSYKKEKTAIIVSDALRYECGEELIARINKSFATKNTLIPALSVLPSYTNLGGLALLPHNSIDYDKQGNVILDGLNVAAYDNREKHLNTYRPGKVLSGSYILDRKNSAKIKSDIKGTELIYIYHDRIDAVGDNVPTERDVFKAAEDCFDEILQIFQILQNNSVYNVYITTDHGFLYRREDIRALDKTKCKVDDALLAKRRFLITAINAVRHEFTRKVGMEYIIGNQDYIVEVPYGTNVFPKQGESKKYVHGGDSLQEVVIPIIKIENKKKDREKNRANAAEIKLVSITRKISSLIQFMEFLQEKPVDDKILSCNYEAYFVEADGTHITNSIVINCDSKSASMADRTYKEKFTFKNKKYNSEEQIYMIIKDYDDPYAEETRIPFNIDIMFSNKFDF